ncbi:uncharacterized protein LOC134269581 [Saccostrea cucullata]|uniref:uncharacterized protein LOC134269581 n=1 Tax=Saccostrea cuccullata TaxID=36930 RepID=UPI002ED3BED7
MRCDICGKIFSRASNLNLHVKEQNASDLECLSVTFAGGHLPESINYGDTTDFYKLDGTTLSGAMDRKRYSVKRQIYEEAKKPVCVLSEQYENISSDEEFTTENEKR